MLWFKEISYYGLKKLVTVGISAHNLQHEGASGNHMANTKWLSKQRKSQKREDSHMNIEIIQIIQPS